MSRYELGLCQKFNKKIHGFHPDSISPEIKTHYICLLTYQFTTTFCNLQESIAFANCYGATIEIIETHVLYPGTETIAIYKTFWLRIFQRMCRKWITQRRFSRSSRMYSFLLKREYRNTSISL